MSVTRYLENNEHPVDRLVRDITSLAPDAQSPAIEDLVRNPDPEIRSHSIRVAAKLHHPNVAGFCLTLLQDPVWHVRCFASEYAASAKLTQATSALMHLVNSDHNEAVRFNAAVALGQIASEDDIPTLQQIADTATGWNHEGTPIRDTLLNTIEQIRSRTSQ